ncbi:hypothetical protein Aph01nite_03210 [Acrocarpospora phusangensis]|uniref:Uncharacterized protein n=1 Tax=Acrocarpospora phusangensis TaxID=1070424 RepID=A0A919Q5J4_9ACTN|nr:hypothetical protein Aph01nite_03210 [Acrocarpospora phusangensis]
MNTYDLPGVEGIRKSDPSLFGIARHRRRMRKGSAYDLDRLGPWPHHEHEVDHVVTDVLQALEVLHGEA